MSTLRVDTIQNASGTDSPISVPGTAKAWVNFNGTGTVAIRASYNVSSITDNNTGNYTVNFTNAMADANYATVVSRALTTDTSQIVQVVNTQTTGGVSIVNSQPGVSNYDSALVCVAIFR